MPTYKVDITYNMGMTRGGETCTFEAEDDDAAKAFVKERDGMNLDVHKRNVQHVPGSISRVI